ncbi:MAG: alpha/beta hydrolase fold domain-containing protein [Pseudomonadota bacterium]
MTQAIEAANPLGMLTIDPAKFRPEAITAETQAMNDKLEEAIAEAPELWDLGAPKVRELRREGKGIIVMEKLSDIARWETATALGRDVPVRLFHPGGELRGVYLHIHGGGHTLGSADSQDQTLERMARAAQVGVVSVEYRLAPEHVWPACADDCETAAVWLAERANELFGTDRVVIGGESAGGHLSAVTIMRMRRKHDYKFAGANLVYGVYDCSELPAMRNWGDRNLIINTPIVRWFAEQVRPKAEFADMDLKDPDLSPAYADLNDLCPALFSCGTLDPLLDDTLLMAPKWLAAGNHTELEIYPGGIHAFDMIPDFTLADEHHTRAAKFVVDCLS